MAEPCDGMAAGVGGRPHLRASHAEREQVIGLLKAAFVEERLAKDEFDERVGQVLTSRTRGELAMLTADIPARLPGLQPPQAVREWSDKKAAAAVIGSIAAWWGIVAAASFWVADAGSAQRSTGVVVLVILLHMSIISIWLIAALLEKRAKRRSARLLSRGGGGQASQAIVPSTCH
jgi:hypothetical protein